MGLQETISLCCQGAKKSQGLLLDAYASKVMFICRRYSNKLNEADDLFQETWIRIFSKLELFNTERGDFGSWIHRLSVNVCINQINRSTKFEYIEMSEIENSIKNDELILSNISKDEIFSMVDQLPLGQKVIFNLHVVEGYKHEEISDMLNITTSTSRSNLSRGKEKLKTMILKRS